MGLCLTYHVNLKLSTRHTAHALQEVHGIDISHTMVPSYAMTYAAVILHNCIKILNFILPSISLTLMLPL